VPSPTPTATLDCATETLAGMTEDLMRQLLRESLAFNGVVVSDDLGATVAVAHVTPADRASTDVAFRGRVDDAALRVLRAKAARGLLACGRQEVALSR